MVKKQEKQKDKVVVEQLVDMVAYQSGYGAFPSGENPYPSSAGLNNQRYSFWMGFYDKKLEKYKDWPMFESKAKGELEVDLSKRFGGSKKKDDDIESPPDDDDDGFART